MQSVTRSTWLALICLSLIASEDAFAQGSIPGAAAALRERGILSRLGTRLEARQDRLNHPAPNNQRGPAPGPNVGAARAPQAGNGQPERAPALDQAQGRLPAAGEPTAGQRDRTGVRSAQYASPDGGSSQADIQSASAATAPPPNRLPYRGRGVSLRLPADQAGEVNYLVDDREHMRIGAGEEQHLRAKGRYEIRFSRGIDDAGRSYGEARYAITEGAYRFAVTDNGWELFREPDAPKALHANRPEPSQARVPEPQQAVVPEPLEPSQLSELRHREPIRLDEPAEPVQPAESETLPSPTPTLRSILESE